jgi:hypothetical protein
MDPLSGMGVQAYVVALLCIVVASGLAHSKGLLGAPGMFAVSLLLISLIIAGALHANGQL